jgi:hypothetical protein
LNASPRATDWLEADSVDSSRPNVVLIATKKTKKKQCNSTDLYRSTADLIGSAWTKVDLKDSVSDQQSQAGTITSSYDKGLLDPAAQYRGFDYKYSAIVTVPGINGRQKLVMVSSDDPVKSVEGDITIRGSLTAADGTVTMGVARR